MRAIAGACLVFLGTIALGTIAGLAYVGSRDGPPARTLEAERPLPRVATATPETPAEPVAPVVPPIVLPQVEDPEPVIAPAARPVVPPIVLNADARTQPEPEPEPTTIEPLAEAVVAAVVEPVTEPVVEPVVDAVVGAAEAVAGAAEAVVEAGQEPVEAASEAAEALPPEASGVEAGGPTETPASSLPFGRATAWEGRLGGRPTRWRLEIGDDGAASLAVWSRIGADAVSTIWTGSARSVEGDAVELNLRDGRARALRGLVSAAGGSGSVWVRGRRRARWQVAPSGADAAPGVTDP